MMQSSQQGQRQELISQAAVDLQQIHYERKRFDDHTIRDDKIWSRINLVVAILVVSILLLGVGSSFLGLTSIAYVEIAGGSLTSAVSILFYRPRKDIIQRIDNIYEKQVQAENIRLAFLVLGTLQGEAYECSAKTIIDKLVDVQPEDREVPELPVERQSNEKTPPLPTNLANDTNT